jgi:hypothetical protein
VNLELDSLSRKAARGDLSPAERARLEALLREHPEARAQTEWDAAFTAKLAEKVEAMPPMPGWARAEQALRAAARSEGARQSRREPGIFDRIADWMNERLGWTLNVQAIAAALVLSQAGVIGLVMLQDRAPEYGDIRGGVQGEAPSGPLLRVSFRPDVQEAAMRQALADIGGEIVGGPGQLGVYLVRVQEGGLAAAADRLRASGTTALVEIFEAKR